MPAHNFKDLTGQRFGRLAVVEFAGVHPTKRNSLFRCVCDCGEERVVKGNHLLSGNTTSCGCTRLDDLTGQTFGDLTVLEQAGRYQSGGGQGVIWRCKCVCGGEIETRATHLRSGTTVSCGCAMRGIKNRFHKPVSSRYSAARSGAKQRDLTFELTLEQFAAITELPCAYCGQERGSHRGVDRVDSKLGYVEGNCVPCCWICNRFKGSDLSPEEMVEVARNILQNSIGQP